MPKLSYQEYIDSREEELDEIIKEVDDKIRQRKEQFNGERTIK